MMKQLLYYIFIPKWLNVILMQFASLKELMDPFPTNKMDVTTLSKNQVVK